jgi:hypothetical protein
MQITVFPQKFLPRLVTWHSFHVFSDGRGGTATSATTAAAAAAVTAPDRLASLSILIYHSDHRDILLAPAVGGGGGRGYKPRERQWADISKNTEWIYRTCTLSVGVKDFKFYRIFTSEKRCIQFDF